MITQEQITEIARLINRVSEAQQRMISIWMSQCPTHNDANQLILELLNK